MIIWALNLQARTYIRISHVTWTHQVVLNSQFWGVFKFPRKIKFTKSVTKCQKCFSSHSMSSGKLNVRIYQLKKRYRAEQLNHDIIMDITVYIDSRVTLLYYLCCGYHHGYIPCEIISSFW